MKTLENGLKPAIVFLSLCISALLLAIGMPTLGASDKAPEPRPVDCSYPHVHSLEWSPDGKLLAYIYALSFIALWDVNTGRLLHEFNNNGPEFSHVRFSPDRKLVGACGGCGPEDTSPCSKEQLKFWNAKDYTLVKAFDDIFPIDTGVWDFDFSPDSKRVAYDDFNAHKIVIRTIKSGEILKEFPSMEVQVIKFSPDGTSLAVFDGYGFRLIRIENGKAIMKLHKDDVWKNSGAKRGDLDVWSIAFSRDGKSIYLGTDLNTYGSGHNSPALFSVKIPNGKVAGKLEGYSFFSMGGNGMVAALDIKNAISKHVNIDIWDWNSKKLINSFLTCNAGGFAISPDGKLLGASIDSSSDINLWDVSSGDLVKSLSGKNQ